VRKLCAAVAAASIVVGIAAASPMLSSGAPAPSGPDASSGPVRADQNHDKLFDDLAATLAGHARDAAFDAWSIARQRRAQNRTTCVGDQLPEVASIPLTDYLTYLRLD
jgi:hypothetical protein